MFKYLKDTENVPNNEAKTPLHPRRIAFVTFGIISLLSSIMNKEQRETSKLREKEFIEEQVKFLDRIEKIKTLFVALVKPFLRGLFWVFGKKAEAVLSFIFGLIMLLSALSVVGAFLWIFISIFNRNF